MSTEQGNKNVKGENLTVQEITDEATNKPSDETVREYLRGDESKGDADERDLVGGSDLIDTPHGREEAKPGKG